MQTTEIKETKFEGFESDSVETVVKEQWKRNSYSLSISWNMCGEIKESESLMTLSYGGVQLQITNDKNMFQTMYKWTMEIVNVGTELVQENEVSFHLLKENAKGKIVLGDYMVAKGKNEYSKEGSSHSIAKQQWKRQFMQQGIVESM